MKILIPVYPLTNVNKRAIQGGIEFVNGLDDSELLLFHLNEVQKDRRVTRKSLRKAVESTFDGLDASYVVRDGFLSKKRSSKRRFNWRWTTSSSASLVGIDGNDFSKQFSM